MTKILGIIDVKIDGRIILIKAENDFAKSFEGSDIAELLADKYLPQIPGIYKCTVPIDLEECNCNITIKSCN